MSDRIPTQRLVIHLHPVVPSQIAGNVSKVDDRDSVSIRVDLIVVVGWDEEKQNSQILLDFQAGIQRITVTERPELIFKAIEDAEREIYAGSMKKAAFGMTHAVVRPLTTKPPPAETKDDTPS